MAEVVWTRSARPHSMRAVPAPSLLDAHVAITQALGVMQQELLTATKPTAAAVNAASDRIDAILRD